MLEIRKRSAGEVLVVDVDGTIDGGDSCRRIHEVIHAALESGTRKFVLNLAGVDWINSLGVGFLVAAAVAAARQDAHVRLVGMTSRVDSVLRACGVVPHVWRDFADEAEALASLA